MAKRPLTFPSKPSLPAALPVVTVDPRDLYRVSSHSTGEPYFGRNNVNRFDDPNPVDAARYGTSYFGLSLAVAVAETLLHDRRPVKNCFVVKTDEIVRRHVLRFAGKPLTLADCTGAALKLMGGMADLSATSSYAKTKKWSAALHAHPDNVDGFLYMSRHKSDEKAIVLFDRAAPKLRVRSATRLSEHPEFGRVATDFRIRGDTP